MEAVFNTIVERAEERNKADEDYIDSDGLLVCGTCHTRKQTEIQNPFSPGTRKMPCMCSCGKQEFEQEEADRKAQELHQRIQALKRDGLTDSEYFNWTFERDDRQHPEISNACRKYVEEWELMRSDNIGLLFFGNVGTGKSFYACCIANALLEKQVPALVTNFPRILQKLQAGFGNNGTDLFDRLQKYELVVIDDLGAERNTEYALEQVFAVIDTRYRSGKPLIVTTNLAPADIKNPANTSYARIYDRILQNALPVKMTGASRRSEIATQKREKYQSLLGL